MDIEFQHNNSLIQLLKMWSGKQNYSVIFDTDRDGDGKGTLQYTILNKQNIYFIHFDDEMNIFGGYLNKIIDSIGSIFDPNLIYFTFKRNGKIQNEKLTFKSNDSISSFSLYWNSCLLYDFGYYGFIHTCKIGSETSYCNPFTYLFERQQSPFVDKYYPHKFSFTRILVIEMY